MILPAAQFTLSQPVDEEEEEGEGKNGSDSRCYETQAEVADLAAAFVIVVPPIADPLAAGVASPEVVATLRGSAQHRAAEDRQLAEAGAHLALVRTRLKKHSLWYYLKESVLEYDNKICEENCKRVVLAPICFF